MSEQHGMIPVSDGLRRGAIRGNRAGVRGLVLASFSLALLVFVSRRHSDTRERSFLLVEENARGKNIDPLLQPLQEARRSEQNAVAQLRAAVLKAEGLTKNGTLHTHRLIYINLENIFKKSPPETILLPSLFGAEQNKTRAEGKMCHYNYDELQL